MSLRKFVRLLARWGRADRSRAQRGEYCPVVIDALGLPRGSSAIDVTAAIERLKNFQNAIVAADDLVRQALTDRKIVAGESEMLRALAREELLVARAFVRHRPVQIGAPADSAIGQTIEPAAGARPLTPNDLLMSASLLYQFNDPSKPH